MTELSQKVCEMRPDDLVINTQPPCRIDGATVRKSTETQLLKRGSVMAKSSVDGKLVILGSNAATGETLEAYGILTDNIVVGTDEDVSTAIYISGKFNSNKITVEDGYTITEKDKDTLRKYGIEFTAALSY